VGARAGSAWLQRVDVVVNGVAALQHLGRYDVVLTGLNMQRRVGFAPNYWASVSPDQRDSDYRVCLRWTRPPGTAPGYIRLTE